MESPQPEPSVDYIRRIIDADARNDSRVNSKAVPFHSPPFIKVHEPITKDKINRKKFVVSVLKAIFLALCLAPIDSEYNVLYNSGVKFAKSILNINATVFVNDITKTMPSFLEVVTAIVSEVTTSINRIVGFTKDQHKLHLCDFEATMKALNAHLDYAPVVMPGQTMQGGCAKAQKSKVNGEA